MFKLFSKKESSAAAAVALKPMDNITVEQIHRDFETVSEKNLEEAYNIINGIDKDGIEKAKRLQNLGFKSSTCVTSKKEEQKSLRENEEISKLLVDMQKLYPQYKFITADNVNKICQKYSLYCGPVSNFIGEVPTKNLVAIENFKAKDLYVRHEITNISYRWGTGQRDADIADAVLKDFYVENDDRSFATWKMEDAVKKFLSSNGVSIGVESVRFKTVEAGFEICAPLVDFDTKGLKRDGNFLIKGPSEKFKSEIAPIPDPVVLKRISKEGYLIVTAWGPEASDPLVVNEINN